MDEAIAGLTAELTVLSAKGTTSTIGAAFTANRKKKTSAKFVMLTRRP